MTAAHLTKLRDAILSWPGVSGQPHRFGGVEFRMGGAEIGHLHDNGILDIPFTRLVRDELISQNRVTRHRWVPDSGWATFRVRTQDDVSRGLWLMRLSSLRFKLKTASRPQEVFTQESEELGLNPVLRNALSQFLPAKDRHTSAQRSGSALTP